MQCFDGTIDNKCFIYINYKNIPMIACNIIEQMKQGDQEQGDDAKVQEIGKYILKCFGLKIKLIATS